MLSPTRRTSQVEETTRREKEESSARGAAVEVDATGPEGVLEVEG